MPQLKRLKASFRRLYIFSLLSPHPIRRYFPSERPFQLVSPATQLTQRLVAVAEVTPSTRVSPTQPTQTPLTRSVTSPFSLCAEFSSRSTNYSTRPKRRSKSILRPRNEYLSKCGHVPAVVLTSHIPASEHLTASPVAPSITSHALSESPQSLLFTQFPPFRLAQTRIISILSPSRSF